LTLPRKHLDDWDYDDFVAAALKRIPELTDRWTDFNPSDPGITLIELLSWLAASQLFHLDQITESHRRVFLKLLGSEPGPPAPSSYITFWEEDTGEKYLPAHEPRPLDTPARTFIFETPEELYFEAVALPEAYLSVEGEPASPVADFAAVKLFSDNPQPGDSFTVKLGCRKEPAGKIGLYFDLDGLPGDKIPLGARFYPNTAVVWEYFAKKQGGKKEGEWKPLPEEDTTDETFGLIRSGVLAFGVPDVYVDPQEASPGGLTGQDVHYILIRGRLQKRDGEGEQSAFFERTPALKRLLPNPVVRDEKFSFANVSPVTPIRFSEAVPVKGDNLPETVQVPVAIGRDPSERVSIVQWREKKDAAWKDLAREDFELTDSPEPGFLTVELKRVGSGEVRVILTAAGASLLENGSKVKIPIPFRLRLCGWVVQRRKRAPEPWIDLNGVNDDCITEETEAGKTWVTVGIDESVELRLIRWVQGGPDSAPGAPRLEGGLPKKTARIPAYSGRSELRYPATGRPGFVIELTAPALPGFVVQVEESAGKWFDWQETADIRLRGKDDRSFCLSPDRRRAIFGDGAHGRVPSVEPAAPKRTADVRIIEYATTHGFAGEAGGAILYDAGRPAEALGEAVWRAREDLARPPAAVTLEDYRNFALKTPGVAVKRAEVIVAPVEGATVTGESARRVVVVVIPETGRPRPAPGPAFLRTVRAYLERYRLITTRLDVAGPDYSPIQVRVRLAAAPGYGWETVGPPVKRELTRFFGPLEGGEAGTGWPLGRSVYVPEVVAAVMAVPGVERVVEALVWRRGELPEGRTDELTLGWKTLPLLTEDDVNVEFVEGG
jgi:hypothetical protein